MKIPARIIQTGRNRTLTPLAKAAVTGLRLLHPDWEYLYFDDEEIRHFITTEFPQHLTVFDTFPQTIQRIDFFRYLVVFRFGGFYFDLDVFLSENIGSLLQHDCVFPFEELTINRYLRRHHGMDWELGNYAFGAKAGDPFLEAVIANCIRAQKDTAWLRPMTKGVHRLLRSEYEVLNTTGPGLLSRTYAEQSDISRPIKILFPADVCDPLGWHQFGSYGVHRMDGSWRTEGKGIRRRIAWRWESLTKARLISKSQRLGPSRDKPLDGQVTAESSLLSHRRAEQS
jgi:hypothetical protein